MLHLSKILSAEDSQAKSEDEIRLPKMQVLGHSFGLANTIKTLLTNYVFFRQKQIMTSSYIDDRFIMF